jgi:hypothetical protein
VGIFVGGPMNLLEVAPTAVAVMMTPLKRLTGGLHPYPSRSPANFAIALPLMIIFWGCFRTLISFLLRCASVLLKSRCRNDDEL